MNFLVRNLIKFFSTNTMNTSIGSKEMKIIECLTKSLSPLHLEVKNESYMHNVPKGNKRDCEL